MDTEPIQWCTREKPGQVITFQDDELHTIWLPNK